MINVKNVIPVFLCLLAALSFWKLTVHGAEIEITNSVENRSRSGIVDISLEQYHLVDDKLQKESVDRTVLPGEQYSLIPIIRNEGNDCYVRLKVDLNSFFGETDAADDLNLANIVLSKGQITGLSDNWIMKDEYLYYTDVLRHGESQRVFDGIQISDSVGKEYAGANVEVTLLAEAVQCSEFQPDFQSDSPWGDIQGEKSKEEKYDYEGLIATSNSIVSVAYEGDAKKLIIVPDDFFGKFEAMLPGQIYTDEVNISNDSECEMELFLKIEPDSTLVLKDNTLLSQMYIRIEKADSFGNSTFLYEGKYLDEKLQNYISVGTYLKGEDAKLVFSIYLPAELGNPYSLLEETSLWTFMTKMEEEQIKVVPKQDAVKESVEERTIVERIVQTVAAKTGDYAPVVLLFMLVLGALFVLFLVAFAHKKKWR